MTVASSEPVDRPRGVVGLTIAAVVGVAILLSLGVWQMERRAWKLGLIARIESRVAAPPVPLATALATARTSGDVEYLRVAATGRYLPLGVRWVYAPTDAGLGYNRFESLVTTDNVVLLVNRGWVPSTIRDDASRQPVDTGAAVTVVGLVRKQAAASVFAPAADKARDEYYWPDYDGMLASLPPEIANGRTVAPFALDAQSEAPSPGTWPRPGTTNLDIPNRHLEYALTWFGLAATLLGVYAALLLSRRRPKPFVPRTDA